MGDHIIVSGGARSGGGGGGVQGVTTEQTACGTPRHDRPRQ